MEWSEQVTACVVYGSLNNEVTSVSTEEIFTHAILLAWQGKLEISQLLHYASQFEENNLGILSIVLYRTWLERNMSPYVHAVHFNLGVTLTNHGDFVGAERAYRRAIEIAPDFAQPRLNLGSLYERLGEIDKALAEWRWVKDNISCERPENQSLVVFALNHLGRVLETKKKYQEAEEMLAKSLEIDPNQPDAIQHWVHLRQKQCVWPVYPELGHLSQERMKDATSALAILSVSDDPQVQLGVSRRFVENKVLSNVAPLANPKGYQHKKIRIAYCSSDFSLHPVSMLTVELFELHDRECFEVYGFCWSPEDGSNLRKRVVSAMDHFIRINELSDEQAAQLIREQEIDILVDLQGLTSGTRPNLLAYKPAPIQITYLGLPATTGLPCIDYIIADRFLIPQNEERYYSEKPLHMPHVFQVSDRRRIAAEKPSRQNCGLPAEGFVFCSFNNNFKFTQEMFRVWMNILRRVPESVLWLLADNPWAEANLRREAKEQGLSAERLIFTTRVSPENYLARYQCADLFLDTFPFNAGTTANDALWMGLPVLTYSGRSFASRMAGSLLTVAGLNELSTNSFSEYEEKAVWLANNKNHCHRLRERLQEVRKKGVLFDTALFVRNLEHRLKQLAVLNGSVELAP
ncbi:protein O-GlcNAc transferase [Gammaproteobacteria bacterium]